MRIEVSENGQSLGEFDVLHVFESIQNGIYGSAHRFRLEGEDTWREIDELEFDHGEEQPRPGSPTDAYGPVLIATPFVAAIIAAVVGGAVAALMIPLAYIASAVLVWKDATALGIGNAADLTPAGGRRLGPLPWALLVGFFWPFGYPIYMFRRARYGVKGFGIPAIVSIVVLICAAGYGADRSAASRQAGAQSQTPPNVDTSKTATTTRTPTTQSQPLSGISGGNPGKIDSIEAVQQYVVGAWTFTEVDRYINPLGVWQKWVFKEDGTVSIYSAIPSADDWGEPEMREWEALTNKYRDTGQRWYGVQVKGYIAPAIIREDGRLNFKPSSDPALVFSKGDKFPFSK